MLTIAGKPLGTGPAAIPIAGRYAAPLGVTPIEPPSL